MVNSCSRTFLVAIMFQYQPWGEKQCLNAADCSIEHTPQCLMISHHLPCRWQCARSGKPIGCNNDAADGMCTTYWYELPPGASDYYAQTDFHYWYWTACFADAPTVCFNSALSTRYTLAWKPCSVVDNTHCFGWKSVSCTDEQSMHRWTAAVCHAIGMACF